MIFHTIKTKEQWGIDRLFCNLYNTFTKSSKKLMGG